MKMYDLMSDDAPQNYITLAYGNTDDLNDLAAKLFNQLNLVIILMPSGVHMLVLLYEIDFRVIR